MHTQDESKLVTARVVAALKAGTVIAVLGFIVIMVERPMISAAAGEVGTTPDEVSFLPHAILTADAKKPAAGGTSRQTSGGNGLSWNFAAPGNEAPPTF